MPPSNNPGSRIKGTSENDTLIGTPGDDTIQGGAGLDTLTLDGSIFDYEWEKYGDDWIIEHEFDYFAHGRDLLQDVEFLQFDDVLVDLTQDMPTVMEGPTSITVFVGQSKTVSYSFSDMDNKGGVKDPFDSYYPFKVALNKTAWESSDNAFYTDFDITVDTTQLSGSAEVREQMPRLAKGEKITIVYPVQWTRYEEGDGLYGSSYTFDVEINVVGVNDAPVVTNPSEKPMLWARKGVFKVAKLDLRQFADDIDNDTTVDDLRYEIGWKTEGYSAWINGHTLYFSGGTIPLEFAADEFKKGQANIRVYDEHGARADDVLKVEIRAAGFDETKEVYVTPGGLRMGALGLKQSDALNVGRLWSSDVTAEHDALFAATGGKDVKYIKGYELANLSFDLKSGNDIFFAEMVSEAGGQISGLDVRTGFGEDVVALVLRGSQTNDTIAVAQGLDIDTGMSSDQVLICMVSDYGGWISGDLRTGSGADRVEIHMTDPDKSDGGHAFSDLDIWLGTGKDKLNFVINTGPAAWQAAFKGNIYAGGGNDEVNLSNEGTRISPPDDGALSSGPEFDDLFAGGLQGKVWMGGGNDRLTVALNDAYRSESVGGLYGGKGYDILTLDHISRGEAVFTQVNGSLIKMTDGLQTIWIAGFEEIWLEDGTDVFNLV